MNLPESSIVNLQNVICLDNIDKNQTPEIKIQTSEINNNKIRQYLIPKNVGKYIIYSYNCDRQTDTYYAKQIIKEATETNPIIALNNGEFTITILDSFSGMSKQIFINKLSGGQLKKKFRRRRKITHRHIKSAYKRVKKNVSKKNKRVKPRIIHRN